MSSCQTILTTEQKKKRHRGDHTEFVVLHRRAVRLAQAPGSDGLAALQKTVFRDIHDFRTLRYAWEFLSENCGHAPGVDGETYSDYGAQNEKHLWDALRSLGNDLRTAHYVPEELKEIKIPKSSGKGFRTLRLPTIWDRVVERSVLEIVQPMVEPTFDCRSFGWRPGRSQIQAVEAVRQAVEDKKRTVWVCDDIKDCFEHVPRKRLLDVLQTHIASEDTVELISNIIGKEKKRGLSQGGPLSPFLANVYLDHFVDKKWRQLCPEVPLVRSADDIVLLCLNRDEADAARAQLRAILRTAGFQLKASENTAIRDLASGQSALWLGLRATWEKSRLNFEIALSGWISLESKLDSVVAAGEPEFIARDVLEGWILQAVNCGVTVQVDDATEQTINILYDVGLGHLVSLDAIRGLWRGDNSLWNKLRQQASKMH